MNVAAKRPRRSLPTEGITIERCDHMLMQASQVLRKADVDEAALAVCRIDIDRWLDIRLALMRGQ